MPLHVFVSASDVVTENVVLSDLVKVIVSLETVAPLIGFTLESNFAPIAGNISVSIRVFTVAEAPMGSYKEL